MSTSTVQDNYLQSAVQSASPVGLTIMLYDRLVTDLRVAIEAMKSNNIEKRCVEINHAFLILGWLEENLDTENGGETAASLSRFYGCIRSQCIAAQSKNAPEILEQQIELILQVREAWQKVESNGASVHPSSEEEPGHRSAGDAGDEHTSSSWTA